MSAPVSAKSAGHRSTTSPSTKETGVASSEAGTRCASRKTGKPSQQMSVYTDRCVIFIVVCGTYRITSSPPAMRPPAMMASLMIFEPSASLHTDSPRGSIWCVWLMVELKFLLIFLVKTLFVWWYVRTIDFIDGRHGCYSRPLLGPPSNVV